MTTTIAPLQFTQTGLADVLERVSDTELDLLDFGVIGFDQAGVVTRYNQFESRLAGLSREKVIGNHLFTTVAPCMNNYLVAQRFEDALAAGSSVDVTLDYVFTLKMRPKKVTLRLLTAPGLGNRYVLVKRDT